MTIHELTGPARPEPADRERARRPGVPMILPTVAPSLPPLEPQTSNVPVLVGPEVFGLTPIFGTTCPPRGLSGMIRRSAYAIPEHKASRWLCLILADRVDVVESTLRRHPFLALGALGLLGAALLRRR